MSSSVLRTPVLLRSSFVARPVSSRAFHITARRSAMGEDDLHRDAEDHKGDIEEHKQDSIKKQKNGNGHWKPELASNSESAVRADREEIRASEENIKKMQKETEEMTQKK